MPKNCESSNRLKRTKSAKLLFYIDYHFGVYFSVIFCCVPIANDTNRCCCYNNDSIQSIGYTMVPLQSAYFCVESTWKMVCNFIHISVNVFLLWIIFRFFFSAMSWHPMCYEDWSKRLMITIISVLRIYLAQMLRAHHTHTHFAHTVLLTNNSAPEKQPNEFAKSKHRNKNKSHDAQSEKQPSIASASASTKELKETDQHRASHTNHSARERDGAFSSIRNKRCKQ